MLVEDPPPLPRMLSMVHTSPTLPVELFLEIASFIDRRIDLLALASTCHVLYSSLVPHWLDFIDVSSPIPCTPLWAHLSERPILCQRIRTLKLTDSMTLEATCVPHLLQSHLQQFLTTSSSTNQPQLIYGILPNLKNLRSFRGFFKSSSITSVVRVAECLKRSGCMLEALELFMMTGFDEAFGGLKRARFSCFNLNLSTLSQLSITVSDYDHAEAVRLVQILADLPNLVRLKLCPPNSDDCINNFLHDLFTKCHWPKLRDIAIKQIYLPNVIVEAYSSALRTFLSRHLELETFYLDNRLVPGCFSKVTVEHNGSKLKAIHFMFPNPDTAASVEVGNVLPGHISRNLVHLSISCTSNVNLGIRANGLRSLRSCSLPRIVSKSQFSWIAEFMAVAPNLEKCAVTINSNFRINEITEIAQMLSSVKKLTHLINLLANVNIFQLENEKQSQILDCICRMPSLTYINTIIPHEGKQFIRILRNSSLPKPALSQTDGSYLEPSSRPLAYEIISGTSLPRHELEYTKWGNFF